MPAELNAAKAASDFGRALRDAAEIRKKKKEEEARRESEAKDRESEKKFRKSFEEKGDVSWPSIIVKNSRDPINSKDVEGPPNVKKRKRTLVGD